MNNIMNKSIYFMLILLTCSCKKQDDWLDYKYNKNDIIPTSVKDFQAMLDQGENMLASYNSFGGVSADNYYTTTTDWQNAIVSGRNSYIWAPDIFEGGTNPADWLRPYANLEVANVVIDGLKKLEASNGNTQEFKNCKGIAYFFRAFCHYNVAQVWCKPYSSTASTDLGIPIKVSSDVNEPINRFTVQKVYDQIIADLQTSLDLLPQFQDKNSRPSRIAATSLLAKVYFNMEDYTKAASYATEALNGNKTLLNFNNINMTASFPFPDFKTVNPEIYFYATGATTGIYSPNRTAYVDTNLYASYAANDLRKTGFYRTVSAVLKQYVFKGTYSGSTNVFTGLAVNETYLIRAESYARLNKLPEALADVNTLLEKRHVINSYVPYSSTNAADIIKFIIQERRKELPFTGNARWDDLRRINKDPNYAVTLKRIINNQTYTLPPNDNRYVFPIPPNEILLTGIEQNPR